MKHQFHTLICTVGTSLFYPNLARMQVTQYDNSDSIGLMQADYQTLKKSGWLKDLNNLHQILLKIQEAFKSKDCSELVKQLTKLPTDLRLLGAEINSIEALIRKNYLTNERKRVVFLVSDTEDGQDIGKILKDYFASAKSPIGFNISEIRVVQGLQDIRPIEFKRKGLANLVRVLGEEFRKSDSHYTAINATGGYKAQIAIAVAFGQVAKIPVYYKHERFDQIISFPKIPFSIDLSLVDDNLLLWAQLAEPEARFTYEEIRNYIGSDDKYFDQMIPLLETIEEEGTYYYSLSALGLVYWEEYLNQYPDRLLDPPAAGNRSRRVVQDEHYPNGFKNYLKKVYNDNIFIIGFHNVKCSVASGSGAITSRKRGGHGTGKDRIV